MKSRHQERTKFYRKMFVSGQNAECSEGFQLTFSQKIFKKIHSFG